MRWQCGCGGVAVRQCGGAAVRVMQMANAVCVVRAVQVVQGEQVVRVVRVLGRVGMVGRVLVVQQSGSALSPATPISTFLSPAGK